MPTPDSQVSLRAASIADLARIENMMEFYNYDFSEWYPIAISETGLFALRPKTEYWARPGVKPFIMRVGAELAGFAVVDDEVIDAEAEYNLGYFFVARRHRRAGVGRKAAELLFARFSGNWELYHLVQNTTAGAFWKSVLGHLDCRKLRQSEEVVAGDAACLFRFSLPGHARAPLDRSVHLP
jgi:predicted acetyltransferase